MSRELRIVLDDDDEPEPHPFLVADQKVTTADVVAVACTLGWLAGEPYLTPAVPAR